MAKKKKKKQAKKKKQTKVETVAVKERPNQFEDTTFLDTVADAVGLQTDEKPFLTERQRTAYLENMVDVDNAVRAKLERFLLAFQCPIDSVDGLDDDDVEVFIVGFQKIVRQIVNPFVSAPVPVFDLERLGWSETDYLQWIADVERLHGITVADAMEYLERMEHEERKARNLFRTMQQTIVGHRVPDVATSVKKNRPVYHGGYLRKNLYQSATFRPLIDKAI